MPAGPSQTRPPLAVRASTTIEESPLVELTRCRFELNAHNRRRHALGGSNSRPSIRGKSALRHENRRATSPILATVLTVVMAVFASFAVSGFVFGTISLSQLAPEITVTGLSLPASAFATGGSATTFTCATTSSGASLALSNAGSARGTIVGVTITWAGTNNAFTLSGGCTVGASGSSTATSYINFPSSNKLTAPGAANAVSGGKYSGTITLSGGVKILFTGVWQ